MKYLSGDYQIILQHLQSVGGWVLAGSVRSIDTPFGFIGFRGDRNCRDLVRAGCLDYKRESKPGEKKKFAWVKFLKMPEEEKEVWHRPPKIIRNPHPIQVRETVEKNLALQVYKKEKVEEVAGLFN